jgi:glutamine synthetase type III
MAVICATLAKEFIEAEKKIKEGYTIDSLIEELLKDTQPVRFEDDGYSHEWGEEAKKRGLYVNESFCELFDRLNK